MFIVRMMSGTFVRRRRGKTNCLSVLLTYISETKKKERKIESCAVMEAENSIHFEFAYS